MISAIVHTLTTETQRKGENADWPCCPKCGRLLASYQKRDSVNTRFKLNTLEIYGYCNKCGSCQIEQAFFTADDAEGKEVWKIIKFRFFELKPKAWQKVQDLPVPLLATGNSFTTENTKEKSIHKNESLCLCGEKKND